MSKQQKTMQLQFTHQDFQTHAVQSVVQVFDGQPLAKSELSFISQRASVDYATDGSIGNKLHLSDEQLLTNVQKVQKRNGIELSTKLVASTSSNKKETYCPYNFTIHRAWQSPCA